MLGVNLYWLDNEDDEDDGPDDDYWSPVSVDEPATSAAERLDVRNNFEKSDTIK